MGYRTPWPSSVPSLDSRQTRRRECPPRERCFFFNDPATTEIYTLSLHDALPISRLATFSIKSPWFIAPPKCRSSLTDRKSTRLNSSHGIISYAVFCLKKKNSESLSEDCKGENGGLLTELAKAVAL